MARCATVFPLAVLCLSILAGCAQQPCEPRNGSVNGYCDGNTAYSCIEGCGDCRGDEWYSHSCQTCVIIAYPPPGSGPPFFTNPKPTRWATCAEWLDGGTVD